MKQYNEDLNTAVITTKYVLEKTSPILFVYHFEDGFWQFSGPEEDLIDEDFRMLSLEEIINLDPSILEVSDLPYGQQAERENVNSSWIITKS